MSLAAPPEPALGDAPPTPAPDASDAIWAIAPGFPPAPPLPPVPPPPFPPSSGAVPSAGGHRPPHPAGRARTALAAIVVAVLLLASGFVLGGLRDRDTTQATPVVASATAATSTSPVTSGAEPVATAAAALSPSVVEISTSSGLGSGVIYAQAAGSGGGDASGLILTNAHVVESARAVTVTLDDGTQLAGTVVGSDTVNDIAVVSVDATGLTLTAAQLATTDAVVGQTAIAIGSPYGLDETVTVGIVSAVDRTVETSTGESDPMIQTDASINPGNSGGALADRNGVVIGINTAIYSESGDNAGIGFAIPIQTARQIADQLVGGAD